MIVQRYLFREVLQVFVAVLAVLLIIYVSNRFVRYLAQAASGYISSDLVAQLMLLKLAENLAILLPLALYLAVLLALGRLYRDSEIIAMAAGGIGVRRLAHALLWFASGFALVTGALSLYAAPKAAELQRALFDHAKGKAQIVGIQAGRFRDFGGGERVAYVETISADGSIMGNVFVRVMRRGGQDLLVAERAYPLVQGEEGDRFMVLENGRRYTGSPGQLDFVITNFERHAIRLEQAAGPQGQRVEAVPTLELLRDGGPASVAELQWRLSLPLSLMVLVLLAVPMARTSPRQGRYARLISAFILYFIYNNGIGIARKLLERDELPAEVGVWPVHLVFAVIAVAMIARQTSRLAPPGARAVTLVDRYVARHVVNGTFVWLLALVVLFSFISLVDDLGDVGRGDYTMLRALEYMALTTPRRAFDLFPLAALIGALTGLGALAAGSELVVIRSSGVSVYRICAAVLGGALILMLVAIVLGEAVAPPAERLAESRRSVAIADELRAESASGFWVRDGNSFINIQKVLPGNRMNGVNIYEFDAERRLRVATRASRARYEDGEWVLEGIVQSHIGDDVITRQQVDVATWQALFEPELVTVVTVRPESLSVFGLRRYMGYLNKNGLDVSRYELALWHKFVYPLATGVMIVLAVPMVLGGLKSAGLGQRILVGVLVGIGFHVLNQASGHLGLVYGLNAAVSATAPTLLFAAAAAWMLRRVV